MFQCRGCGRLNGQPRASGPVLCDRCAAEASEAESRRAHLLAEMPDGHPTVGEQVLICQYCHEPFMGAHAGVKFCCTAHRARSWRERQRQATAA
jgi:hypothetical protein